MGRRKIKMEMVQDMNTRQVTFSKRRNGLFKKASELATLCNAELGIVVFSPGGKPFSYGKPDLESVAERYTSERGDDDDDDDDEESGGEDDDDDDDDEESVGEDEEEKKSGKNKPKLKKISDRLDSLNQETEAEKKRGEKAQKKLESAGDKRFKKPIETLTVEELKEYKEKLEELHGRIESEANKMKASSVLMLLLKDSMAPANEDLDN